MCIRPWAASGASQLKALSMRCGVPSASTSRSSGPVGKPRCGPGSGLPGCTSPGLPRGLRKGGAGLRVGRLVAEAAGAIDRAQQDLQHVQDAAGVEAVGVGRDAAHGVHADRPADHLLVAAAGPVGPGDVERDLLLEGGVRQLGGDAADGGGGDAGLLGDRARARTRGRGSARPAAGTPAPPRARRPGGTCPTAPASRSAASAARPARRSSCRGRAACPSSSRANRPSSAAPGSWITSQGALV